MPNVIDKERCRRLGFETLWGFGRFEGSEGSLARTFAVVIHYSYPLRLLLEARCYKAQKLHLLQLHKYRLGTYLGR